MDKDYNVIKLVNGIENAIAEGLADIAIVGIENRIKAYKSGDITAGEMLEYLNSIRQ